MEFSQQQLFILREVTAQITDSRSQLRYSRSALELSFIYHKAEYEPINSILRLLVLGSGAIISYQLWAQQNIILKVIALALLFAASTFLLQGGSMNLEYGGEAVLTFNTSRGAFLLTSASHDSIIDFDEEFPLADIQAVRITPFQSIADDIEVGQIDIYRAVTNTWHLLAELPYPAARDLVSVVQSLTPATLIARPVQPASWPAQVGRRLGQFYYWLSALMHRQS
ncbi:hypothetical protein [Hymenobacter sp. DG01]|uniref:hypothetical protein n=1 Tax=Hymenobacter sp. DG01 TaxID=2584940 RepID=UPI001124B396|nr:hypothetical protein [Hymenobacter sp. DG01]